MKIDPNHPVEFHQECILCEDGKVFLFDGSSSPVSEFDLEDNSLRKFCQSLDPNKCFILAFIPNDEDKDVFFNAREVANQIGLHMQATVDTPERHRALWENYRLMKQYPGEDQDEGPGQFE